MNKSMGTLSLYVCLQGFDEEVQSWNGRRCLLEIQKELDVSWAKTSGTNNNNI